MDAKTILANIERRLAEDRRERVRQGIPDRRATCRSDACELAAAIEAAQPCPIDWDTVDALPLP